MSKTKVALLGTGFIANIHAESYARFVHNAEVVAVYGRDKAHAEAFAAAHGIPAAYGDIDELLAAEQVDVVDICLPNYLHHEACLKAAGANKHVIIEKPLALTLEQADEMIEACRSRGLKPVSYTHLDVYKRQKHSHLWPRIIRRERPMACRAVMSGFSATM